MNDAGRERLLCSIFALNAIEQVAEQVALFGARRIRQVYVERRPAGYRWSIAHRGGPYPLLRELASLLDVPYTSIVLPFDTVDGWAIVAAPDVGGGVDAWTMIEPSHDASINIERILDGLR